MQEKEWTGVTRSAEEDLALITQPYSLRKLTILRLSVFMVMSGFILGVYLYMNHAFNPGYPIITVFAEKNAVFAEHYPPFRMNEWTCYRITEDIIGGRLYSEGSYSRLHPIGFSLTSVPLTLLWGEAGPYYTNALILWLSALVFFFLMLEFVPFPMAVFSTCFLAFATPNLFYASSAFSEAAAQFILVLAMFLFFKGISLGHEWIFYAPAGFLTALNLFVQPVMAVAAVPFVVILIYEHGRGPKMARYLFMFLCGFIVPLAAYLIINKLYLGQFFDFIFSTPFCPYNLSSEGHYGSSRNIMIGIWKLLFDSPNGLVFIMPVVMLIPGGFIALWRNELKLIALFMGILLSIVILFTAANTCPVTGECVGSRHLVPIIPLLIMPTVFMWGEHAGERIWFAVTLALTVYMCTFGWWTGISRGDGFFIGALQDRDARMILLARSDRLERPVFTSSNELEEKFFSSLKNHDMKLWLQTLDTDSIAEIYGFERVVFKDFINKFSLNGQNRDLFIQSVDPDRGIRPVIPNLRLEAEPDDGQVF